MAAERRGMGAPRSGLSSQRAQDGRAATVVARRGKAVGSTTARVEGTQAVERAFAVLSRVSTAGDRGASLGDLVAGSGLKHATVHRLLLALVRTGFVDHDRSTHRYFLGPESHVLGVLASSRHGIRRIAEGSVARLAHVSEDTAFLTVRRGLFAVCLHREEGTSPIRAHVWAVGDRHPLGVGSGSVAMLAALGDDEVEAIIDANHMVYRERYPDVTPDIVRRLIEQTRTRGYCTHQGLGFPGLGGIGMVIRDRDGAPLAALSIGAAASRLGEDRLPMLVELVRGEAARIEQQLHAPPRSAARTTRA